MKTTSLWVALIAVAIIAIVGLFTPAAQQISQFVGGITNYDSVETAGLAVGSGCDNEGSTCTGTTVTQVLEGTCNPTQAAKGSHAATTSLQFFCAVSGVVAGDRVTVIPPVGAGANISGAGSIYGGFVVNGAYATSSDFIGFNVLNLTGAATTSYPQATTTWAYKVTR